MAFFFQFIWIIESAELVNILLQGIANGEKKSQLTYAFMLMTGQFVEKDEALGNELLRKLLDKTAIPCKIMHSEDRKNCKVADFVQFRTCEIPILCSLERFFLRMCNFCCNFAAEKIKCVY